MLSKQRHINFILQPKKAQFKVIQSAHLLCCALEEGTSHSFTSFICQYIGIICQYIGKCLVIGTMLLHDAVVAEMYY